MPFIIDENGKVVEISAEEAGKKFKIKWQDYVSFIGDPIKSTIKPCSNKAVIKFTPGAGYTLVATTLIRKGETLGTYAGEIVKDTNSFSHYPVRQVNFRDVKTTRYIMGFDPYHVDAAFFGNNGRFIQCAQPYEELKRRVKFKNIDLNKIATANVDYFNSKYEIEATQDIHPNEPIVTTYPRDYWYSSSEKYQFLTKTAEVVNPNNFDITQPFVLLCVSDQPDDPQTEIEISTTKLHDKLAENSPDDTAVFKIMNKDETISNFITPKEAIRAALSGKNLFIKLTGRLENDLQNRFTPPKNQEEKTRKADTKSVNSIALKNIDDLNNKGTRLYKQELNGGEEKNTGNTINQLMQAETIFEQALALLRKLKITGDEQSLTTVEHATKEAFILYNLASAQFERSKTKPATGNENNHAITSRLLNHQAKENLKRALEIRQRVYNKIDPQQLIKKTREKLILVAAAAILCRDHVNNQPTNKNTHTVFVSVKTGCFR